MAAEDELSSGAVQNDRVVESASRVMELKNFMYAPKAKSYSIGGQNLP